MYRIFSRCAKLVQCHRDGRRRRPGHQDDLLLVDEGLLGLHAGSACGRVRVEQFHLLAEHALVDLRRELLHQLVIRVHVLDGELPALQLVGALHGIGAGERHRCGHVDRVALRAGRPGADRRLVLRESPVDVPEPGNENRPGTQAQRIAARDSFLARCLAVAAAPVVASAHLASFSVGNRRAGASCTESSRKNGCPKSMRQ